MQVTDEHRDTIERIYRRDADRLWRAVVAYALDRSVADDAVAEAFAQALRRGNALRHPDRWIWSVAFRLANVELAHRRHEAVDERVTYEMAEPARDMVRALSLLSPKQRASVVLHHYAGYPLKEVASMLGSTTAAVKVHVSQGRKRLRTALREEDEGD